MSDIGVLRVFSSDFDIDFWFLNTHNGSLLSKPFSHTIIGVLPSPATVTAALSNDDGDVVDRDDEFLSKCYFPDYIFEQIGGFSLIVTVFLADFFMNNEQSKIALLRNLGHRLPALIVKKVPRRPLLQFVVFNPIFLNVYPVLGAPNPEMKEPEVIRTQKLASGVRIQDIIEGEGPEAHEGSLVEVNYVCRRSNGYFVHSTIDQFSGESSPVILPLDENQIIKGLKEVLVGMKVGGKRRALIPPSAGYTNENLQPIPDEFGPRRSLFSHANEPLVFEVQLLKVL
ncbi:hypothetical protein TEA_003631 [Camellia sinensis var. sinensis]|uniref:peptidylprolyl isomerase n=1 Tax=Camellia sinensis var. sinensis TaxID=542762 RepID=A0A4S4E2Y5_CAMSN|nr:hypothetical protein TEA_003631 [Camellia sinensis var. sinensis]